MRWNRDMYLFILRLYSFLIIITDFNIKKPVQYGAAVVRVRSQRLQLLYHHDPPVLFAQFTLLSVSLSWSTVLNLTPL